MGAAVGLTVKQENLARVLASGKAGSLSEAAEMAGISRSQATRVRQNAAVAKRVSALEDKQADRLVRLIEKSGSRFEEYLDSDDINPQVVALAYTQLRKLKSEIGEDGSQEHSAAEADTASLMILHSMALALRLAARFGVERVSRALAPHVDVLNLDGEQARKVLAVRKVKGMVALARGE